MGRVCQHNQDGRPLSVVFWMDPAGQRHNPSVGDRVDNSATLCKVKTCVALFFLADKSVTSHLFQTDLRCCPEISAHGSGSHRVHVSVWFDASQTDPSCSRPG